MVRWVSGTRYFCGSITNADLRKDSTLLDRGYALDDLAASTKPSRSHDVNCMVRCNRYVAERGLLAETPPRRGGKTGLCPWGSRWVGGVFDS